MATLLCVIMRRFKRMNNLTLINTNDFNGISCDVYGDGNKIFMTRRQIGEALGYDAPNDSIRRIHERHRDRLNKYSVRVGQTDLSHTDKLTYPHFEGQEQNSGIVKLTTPSERQDTYIYNQRGIMEICRWSRQPLADTFMDWVWDIIEAYRDGTLTASHSNAALSTEAIESMIDNRIQYIAKGLFDKVQELQERLENLTIANNNTQSDNATEQEFVPTNQDTVSSQMSKILKECGFNGFTGIKEKIITQAHKLPEDIIKETIEPLAKAYNDITLGYNYTYHKVYNRMDVSWKHRLGRYRKLNHLKNNPPKSKLIANDTKLLKMFVDVVNQLLEEQKRNVTV